MRKKNGCRLFILLELSRITSYGSSCGDSVLMFLDRTKRPTSTSNVLCLVSKSDQRDGASASWI